MLGLRRLAFRLSLLLTGGTDAFEFPHASKSHTKPTHMELETPTMNTNNQHTRHITSANSLEVLRVASTIGVPLVVEQNHRAMEENVMTTLQLVFISAVFMDVVRPQYRSDTARCRRCPRRISVLVEGVGPMVGLFFCVPAAGTCSRQPRRTLRCRM